MTRAGWSIVVLTACATAAPPLTPAPEAPALPPIELADLDGEPWAPSARADTVLVIDVWASYCVPCAKAFPHLNRLDARADTEVVGISVDDEADAVRDFLARVPATFTIVHDPTQRVQDPPLAITALPTVLVVDPVGRVRWRKAQTTEADYRALPGLVDALLATAPPPAR